MHYPVRGSGERDAGIGGMLDLLWLDGDEEEEEKRGDCCVYATTGAQTIDAGRELQADYKEDKIFMNCYSRFIIHKTERLALVHPVPVVLQAGVI